MAAMPLVLAALLSTMVLVSAFNVQINITAGQNITLPCRAPNNNKIIIVMEWSRPDLQTEYVLCYRDEQFDPEEQHPSFKNRVDLQDRQMKDGDVSLILYNVTTADSGTYECRVIQKETNRMKRAHLETDPISVISLRVVPPGQTGGDTEDGGKEAGGKEAGGKEAGGKEAGGKEAGGKEAGGKEDGGEKSGSVGLIVGLSVFAVLLVSAVSGFLIYRKHKKQDQDSYQPPVEMHHV